MQIKWTDDAETGLREVTITYAPATEDPTGKINGFLFRGRLETWLTAQGRPGDYSWITDAGDMYYVLTKIAFMSELSQRSLEGLLLHAKDALGLSYRDIALALEIPRPTAQSKIKAIRRDHAKDGYAYVGGELQKVSPEDAEVAAKVRERQAQREA